MERILQEISAVGCRLVGMDNAITSLTTETKSMRLDIAGFQSRMTGLEQRVTTMECHINANQDRDQELLYLRSKLIDVAPPDYCLSPTTCSDPITPPSGPGIHTISGRRIRGPFNS
ncbi:hypothetical protein NDU88_001964 [Pleurodeles waltl]|uniref:Uncharacterized protein n=1 Tax=Pleurodeles waltl TaxID=8319 RepID=A0AAV7TKN3_PLEWA|nr:hypothetical protein NDU88_001964 [Pleurodeles waltl]